LITPPFWELSPCWIINLWRYIGFITCQPSESCQSVGLSTYVPTWCWSYVSLLGVVTCWVVNIWYYNVLIIRQPVGSCNVLSYQHMILQCFDHTSACREL
jgi:hypothetical protein